MCLLWGQNFYLINNRGPKTKLLHFFGISVSLYLNNTVMAGSRSGSPVKSSPKKKPRRKAAPKAHPSVANMVCQAIRELKDRKGSSFVAIKKYVLANFKVTASIVPHIKRFLRSGVTSGRLVRKSGTGANGRFRVGKTEAPKKKKARKPKKAPKKKAARKPKAKRATKSTKRAKTTKKPKSTKSKAARKSKSAAKPRRRPKATKARKAPKAKKARKPAKK